jgi:predicted PurR-regulated permease PerM
MNERSIDLGLGVIAGERDKDRVLALKLKFNPRCFLAALIVLLSAWILRSFFEPLLWASVIAIAAWPIYRRFTQNVPWRMTSSATPLVFTTLVSLFVLGPMVFAFGALALQAQTWADQILLADKTGLAAPAWYEWTKKAHHSSVVQSLASPPTPPVTPSSGSIHA